MSGLGICLDSPIPRLVRDEYVYHGRLRGFWGSYLPSVFWKARCDLRLIHTLDNDTFFPTMALLYREKL